MTKRFGMGNKKVIKARDLDGDGKKSSYEMARAKGMAKGCLLYTSPSPRDRTRSRMPSSA